MSRAAPSLASTAQPAVGPTAGTVDTTDDLGFELGRGVRFIVCACFAFVSLPILDHRRFILTLSGLPFALTDWVFLGLGAAGLILIPKSLVPRAFPPWVPPAMAASLLVATGVAYETKLAFVGAISMTMYVVATLGIAALAADAYVRRFFAIIMVIVGIRWALYIFGTYAELPPFAGTAWFGGGHDFVRHNVVGGHVAVGGAILAGFFIGRDTRRAYLYAGAALAAASLVISVSLSRQGVIAVVVAAGITVLRVRRISASLVGLVLMAVIAVVAANWFAESGVYGKRAERVEQRYDPLNRDFMERTTGRRRALLFKGLTLLTELPTMVTGVGMHNFGYVEPGGVRRYDPGSLLHSAHLNVWIEGGIVAFIAWLTMLKRTLLVSIRMLRFDPWDIALSTGATAWMTMLLVRNGTGTEAMWFVAVLGGAVADAKIRSLKRAAALGEARES